MKRYWSIFKCFFLLGWVSFGGPAAHIGYFRKQFVEKKQWITDNEYAQLVALSQFLPGPGSSQVGFALGYKRGGVMGGISAFMGFTLPSILIMLAFALISQHVIGSGLYQGLVHGLKLLAVVIVADATLGMYQNFCKTKLTSALCISTAVLLLLFPGIAAQMLILAIAGLLGMFWFKGTPSTNKRAFKPTLLPLGLFSILFFLLPFVDHTSEFISLFNQFYQAGSLVFGGGHVVLPLLQGLIGEQLNQDIFITGYAAAQAVPGPMFTLATYLGYSLSSSPVLGAIIATVAIFLPGFLLLLGILKNWQSLAEKPRVAGAIVGINASVVGLLLAALYQPIISSAVSSSIDVAQILIGYFMLRTLNLSVLNVIMFFAVSGILLPLIG